MIDSGLVGSTDFWEGFRESRRCSRDTYPESFITEYTLVYEDKPRTQDAAEAKKAWGAERTEGLPEFDYVVLDKV